MIKRSSLFLKYSKALVALIACAFGLNALIGLWFVYHTSRETAYVQQQRAANAVAQAVEQFFANRRALLGWSLPFSHLEPKEAAHYRRLDFLRILRNDDAASEIIHVAMSGLELLRVSKTGADRINSGHDWSGDPRFWRGVQSEVSFSPAYYRRETDPAISITVSNAIQKEGLIIAEFSLRSLGRAIGLDQFPTGTTVYLASTSGAIIAHPDNHLVWSRTSVAQLEHFKRAWLIGNTSPRSFASSSVDGVSLLVTTKVLHPLGWVVIVETPTNVAFAPVYVTAGVEAAALAVALMLALLASFLLARRMAAPIQQLTTKIMTMPTSGQRPTPLGLRTGDEIQTLAEQFDQMTQRLWEHTTALASSEERYALCADGAQDGLWDCDVNAQSVYLSRRAHEILALPEADHRCTIAQWLSGVVEDDRARVATEFERHVQGLSAQFRCECRVLVHEGRVTWALLRGMAVRGEDGRALRVAGSVTDITASVQTTEELRRHREHLEEIVASRTAEISAAHRRLVDIIDSAADALIVADASRKVVAASHNCSDLIPFLETPIARGRDLGELKLYCSAGSALHLEDRWRQFFKDGGDLEMEIEIDPDRWVALSAHASTVGYVVRGSDISIYKRAEKALTIALHREKEVGESHRNFVTVASHQFRTPLAVIDSSAQRILRARDQSDPQALAGRVEQIRENVRRMTQLIDRNLTLSLLSEGRPGAHFEMIDFAPIVSRLCAEYRELRLDVGIFLENVSSYPVLVDQSLIEQAIANLLSNAVKFCRPDGYVRVRFERSVNYLSLVVSDNGRGIPPADLASIGKRFYRATNTSDIAGSGIGLTIVDRIVSIHGGSLVVSSKLGEGTTVTISLPFAAKEPSRHHTKEAV